MCLELGGRDGNGELGDEDEDEVVGNAQPWSAWEPCQAFSAFFFFLLVIFWTLWGVLKSGSDTIRFIFMHQFSV